MKWTFIKEYPNGHVLWINNIGIRECFYVGIDPNKSNA